MTTPSSFNDRLAIALVGLVGLGTVAWCQSPLDDLKPRPIHLPAGKYTVAEVLAALEKQTGNRVVDRRTASAPTTVEIGWERQSFWTALESLCTKLGSRFTPYSADGLALVDGPVPLPGHVAGIVRMEVKNVAMKLDRESRSRTCALELEVMWEPRFEPLYLTLEGSAGSFGPDAQGNVTPIAYKARAPQSVAGRMAQTLEIRVPGPDRTSVQIERLTGALRFVGPNKMLDFRVAELGGALPRRLVRDEVGVSVTRIVAGKDLWSVDVVIDNPEGMPAFESYQSWLENNRIHLERDRQIWRHRPQEEQQFAVTPRKAHIRYYFADARDKGMPGEWSLVYRTPARIVELSVPFEFKNVPLP